MIKKFYSTWAKAIVILLSCVSLVSIILSGFGAVWYYQMTDNSGYSMQDMIMDLQNGFLHGFSVGTIRYYTNLLSSIWLPLLLGGLISFVIFMVILAWAAGHRPEPKLMLENLDEEQPEGEEQPAGEEILAANRNSAISKEEDKIYLRWTDKIWYGAFSMIWMTIGRFAILFLGVAVQQLYYGMPMTFFILLGGASFFVGYLSTLNFMLSTITRLKAHKFWHYTMIGFVIHWWKTSPMVNDWKGRVGFRNKVIGLLAFMTIVEYFFIVVTGQEPGAEVFFWLIYKAVTIPAIFWLCRQWIGNRQAVSRVAKGDFSQPIDTNKMYYEFRQEAEDINRISEGVQLAVDRQMTSERMKTELITNVSHDIKTPLTSIINYVDLLQKEMGRGETNVPPALDREKVDEYLDVLARQSTRLKKLIEDLIEASKASSGNLEVHMERLNAKVILDQAIAEFDDRLKNNGLELVLNTSSDEDDSLMIMADGRHLWRVYDNLLGNICKYAMPGTRVYIDFMDDVGQLMVTFRNISKQKLNISPEELMERFTRGDSSRNTEGSGLGLSIANSLTELMGGKLQVTIDGDLFKVEMKFHKA